MTLVRRRDLDRLMIEEEFDGNTDDFDERLIALEDNPPTAVGIDFFEVVGDQFYVHMEGSDAEVLGPYQLPAIQWNHRGPWTALTSYAKHDTVIANGKLYEVIFAHVSAATFDPFANNGMGQDYYNLLLDSFGVPHSSDNAGDDITITPAMINTYIRLTSDHQVTVTFPFSTVEEAPLDSEWQFRVCGDGGVVFVAEDGSDDEVTVNLREDRQFSASTRGAVILVKKVAATELDAFGDLDADESA